MADHQWRIVQFYKLFLSTDGGSHQCESFMSRVEINNQFASLGLSLPGALHACMQLLQHVEWSHSHYIALGHGHHGVYAYL